MDLFIVAMAWLSIFSVAAFLVIRTLQVLGAYDALWRHFTRVKR